MEPSAVILADRDEDGFDRLDRLVADARAGLNYPQLRAVATALYFKDPEHASDASPEAKALLVEILHVAEETAWEDGLHDLLDRVAGWLIPEGIVEDVLTSDLVTRPVAPDRLRVSFVRQLGFRRRPCAAWKARRVRTVGRSREHRARTRRRSSSRGSPRGSPRLGDDDPEPDALVPAVFGGPR